MAAPTSPGSPPVHVVARIAPAPIKARVRGIQTRLPKLVPSAPAAEICSNSHQALRQRGLAFKQFIGTLKAVGGAHGSQSSHRRTPRGCRALIAVGCCITACNLLI